MTTPVLEAMHQQFPAARIDIVCDPRSVDLFVHCPYRGDLLVRDKRQGWRGWWRLLRQVRSQHYALAVDLKTDVLLPCLRATRKLGKVPRQTRLKSLGQGSLHSVEQHFQALSPLLAAYQPPALKLWITAAEHAQVAARLPRCHGRRLVLGLGANSAHKVWPPALYAALADALRAQFSQVVLLGDQRDVPLAEQFIRYYPGQAVSLCGALSLNASCAALATADLFIGNDSALGHMAAAMAVPSVTIFGAGDPQRYRPWSAMASYYQDPQHCLEKVTVPQVLAVVQAQLARLSSTPVWKACA